jgi:transposase
MDNDFNYIWYCSANFAILWRTFVTAILANMQYQTCLSKYLLLLLLLLLSHLQAKSLPLLAEFKTWLIKSKEQVISHNDLSAAIQYCLNQWEKLQRYTLDGHLSNDNNRAERGIKPFVLGRRAWMFTQTANGAKASAVLYSIVETAKANGLTPYNYITYLLEQFSQPEQDLERLLTWNVNLD